MITKYKFDSGKPGNNILIIGSIHGDEKAGSNAIEFLREVIIKGEVKIESGTITCLPYANKEAYLNNKRFIETNLNRVFNSDGDSKEENIAKQIKQEINKADFILDLHTFAKGNYPFVFNDMPDNELVFNVINNLPIEHVVGGWVELYEDTDEMDTIGYTKKLCKSGVLIECGKHNDPRSNNWAFSYIISVLSTLEIIKNLETIAQTQKWIKVDTIIRKKEGDKLNSDYQNFDTVNKGQILGMRKNGDLIAPYDGYIILPNPKAEIGAELLYFGKLTPNK